MGYSGAEIRHIDPSWRAVVPRRKKYDEWIVVIDRVAVALD